MKQFQFRLERLLRYHQQRQKQADQALSRASLDRDTAQAEVTHLHEQIQNTCRLNEAVGQPIEPTQREQSLRHAELLCQTLRGAEEKLKAAERRFREAQSQRAAITQEVEALLHLRTRELTEHQDDVARRQQVELDDVVMKQWSRQNRVRVS